MSVLGWTGFWRQRASGVAQAIGADWIHAQTRYARLLDEVVGQDAVWLDIGCGRQIVPSWAMPEAALLAIVARASQIVGIDFDSAILEHPHLNERVIASGYDLPFAPETFDVVSANMVMEHVGEPARLLAEVARVLKPGGRFVFVTPNARSPLVFVAAYVPDGIKKRIVWFLERRHADDVFPTFYRCNDSRSIRQLVDGNPDLRLADLRLVSTITALTKLGPLGIADIVFMHYGPEERRPNILCVLEKHKQASPNGHAPAV
jgi:SAM-dependent methyltransferase